MQRQCSVHILWDASHIWGLMAWRALRALGVPALLVKAQEIAQGALHGKAQSGVRLLLVPGGSSRLKAAHLGKAGRAAVRDFVARGGCYLGICGGAGLALSHDDETQSLGLCPWKRAPYSWRFQHLISGHLLARALEEAPPLAEPGSLSLPVWWPGRFAPDKDCAAVRVLAESLGPAPDLWLADLPLAGLAPQVLQSWREGYGVDLSPGFLAGQPLLVTGSFGQGRYLLSYSHLETPESPAANAWLAEILSGFGIAVAAPRTLPSWELAVAAPAYPADAPAFSQPSPPAQAALALTMRQASLRIQRLLDLGEEQRLFFRRTPWLWGWKAGLPGMVLNNLLAAFAELESLLCRDFSSASEIAAFAELARHWQDMGERFESLLAQFCQGAEAWLMASRLAAMLAPTMPDAVAGEGLARQRAELFGQAMQGGGLAGELLLLVEACLYAAQGLAHTNGGEDF